MNILLVDDERSFGAFTEVVLTKTFPNATVVQALSCDEAMERAAHESFDLALMDQRLPEISGIDCLKMLRAAVPDLPIVMLTGVSDDAVIKEAMRSGADDYVLKENMLVMLPHVVGSAIERRLAQRRIQQETADRQDQLQKIRRTFLDQRSDGHEPEKPRGLGEAH